MDARSPVPLTPMRAQHQKEMMRGHLEAVSDITNGLATDDWPAIEAAADLLGSSPQMQTMCEHMGAGADGFTERALAFHTTADVIGAAARAKDHAGVEKALGTTLQGCTSCHAAFRQEVVSDAGYAAATGSAPPNHGAASAGSTRQ
jgi:cytochrome c556